MKYVWIGGGVFLAALAALLLFKVSDPTWAGTASAAAAMAFFKAALPSLKKIFKPKPFTDEQKKTIRQGGDPFKKRRPGTGGKRG